MAITTWLTEWERDSMKSVSDKELNELFQEVRKISNEFFLHEQDHTIKQFLRKGKTFKIYTLYKALDNIDVQVINFASDSTWSINTTVPKHFIMNYFFGFLARLKHNEQQHSI